MSADAPEETMPTNQTEAIIGNHLHAFFNKSIDGVVADYAEESVFIIQTGPLRLAPLPPYPGVDELADDNPFSEAQLLLAVSTAASGAERRARACQGRRFPLC